MKYRLLLIGIFILIILTQTFCSICSEIGCQQFDSMGLEATYCRLHREAVWDYIELGENKKSQSNRTLSITRLLGELNQCHSIDCIETEISADTIAIDFNLIYQTAHQIAEEKRNGRDMKVRQVIMCGLENGARDWIDSLRLEVNL